MTVALSASTIQVEVLAQQKFVGRVVSPLQLLKFVGQLAESRVKSGEGIKEAVAELNAIARIARVL